MSYGFQVKDDTGNVTFTTESKVLRSTFAKTVQGGTSGSFSVNDFNESEGFISVDYSGFVEGENLSGVDFGWSWDNSSKVFSYNLNALSSNTKTTFHFISIE